MSGSFRNLRGSRGRARIELLEERVVLTATAWSSYARDAQHSALSTVAGQSLDAIHWETPVDTAPQYSGDELLIHYGSPLVTVSNTVIVPEKNESTGGFDVKAFDGATGALKWTQTEGEEYVTPASSWVPSYSPALAPLPGGARLYFPGADGTIFYRDAPDSSGAVASTRVVFYGSANYLANPAAFAGVRVSSPLTTDSQGNLYFSYRVSSSNPLGLTGGIVRIGADGSLAYADVGTPALNAAPALSNDGTKLYAVINAHLIEYNSTTLSLINQVALPFTVLDQSSASPTVGPDGDVYFGVWSSSDDYRGYLEHYSGDLSTTYVPGSFGWDDTVSIVPASMVPSYSGPSTYLLMSKDNDYGIAGSGINRISLFEPKHDLSNGVELMPVVLSIAGVTPDPDYPDLPGAVREWCINNAVVDPATHSIFANSEDGWLYRWDTTTNTFTQKIQLTSGVGEAYTPTVMGADGTVFAINNAILFAIGQTPSLSIGDVSIAEGNSGTTNAVFTVTLSSSTTQQVLVNFSTSAATATAGSDYQTTSGVLTFAGATTAGGGVTTRTITVPISGDTDPEANETFFVDLDTPVNATIAVSQATGTIVNDDGPILNLTVGAEAPNFTSNWFNGGAVPIENMAQATINNGTSPANLQSLAVTLASFHPGDVLSVPILTGITLTSSYSLGTLTLIGSETVAHYQQELRLINYNNTNGGPGVASTKAVFVANNGTLSSLPVTATVNVSVASGQVLGNRLFYNNSKYDVNNGAINASDDAAIASDKVGYKGTGTANFTAVSGFTRGITGVMVDIDSTLGTHSLINLTSGDVTFKVAPAFGATYNQLSTWSAAPAPAAISVRLGAGTGGSDRLEIAWANGKITDTWLEVDVKATANTGLSADDVFYFGASGANSGLGDTAALARTDASDYSVANNNLASLTTPVWNIIDYTKDGRVDISDANAVTNGLFTLRYIANPTGPFAPDGGGGAAAPSALAASSPSATPSASDAVSSGLTSLLGGHTSLPPWLAGRLQGILSSPPVTKTIQSVLHNPQIVHAIDQIAATFHAHDDALEGLLADLGLE